VHVTLDELIRTVSGAHNALLDLEELAEADLERVRSRYESILGPSVAMPAVACVQPRWPMQSHTLPSR